MLFDERYINRNKECVKGKMGKHLFIMCKEKWVIAIDRYR